MIILFNKSLDTSKELVHNIMKLTGLKELDVGIIIDCIANEIIDMTLNKNKKVHFSVLGTFDVEYLTNRRFKNNRHKEPKRYSKKKRIILKNSKKIRELAENALKKDRKEYENRIVW